MDEGLILHALETLVVVDLLGISLVQLKTLQLCKLDKALSLMR